MKRPKLYRVNESERFNLVSMYDKLICRRIDTEERGEYDEDNEARIAELERLMDKAYCVGAEVDWPTLKRIREIQAERRTIRYAAALAAGTPEAQAADAFAL